MQFSRPIHEIIRQRVSCRTYRETPLDGETRQRLEEAFASLQAAPFGTPVRFALVAATENDRQTLKGLGTYGFIKGAAGFIVGAAQRSAYDMEDYGYQMEQLILLATDLGLGTCWLGGSFTRSRFAERIALQEGESLPAIASLGLIAANPRRVDGAMRRVVGSDKRRPWAELFFDRAFGVPLSLQAAGPYARPLEMVRLAPSATNRQPWRIVRDDQRWHFYLQPSAAYRTLSPRAGDLQRIDIGIAMCHWALTAEEQGLAGEWRRDDPWIVEGQGSSNGTFVATWVGR